MRTSRLQAIVFTDIAGYSRLMESDEERTIELLKRHNAIVLPVIQAFEGEVIDSIGDALFILFASVRRAVECAVAIQESVFERTAEAAESDRFKLRIGVHLGEVLREDGRAYGNGVNVAARVQPFALPGGICVTEDVYRQVDGRIPNAMVSIGSPSLRNISRQYELFRVVTGHEDESQQERTPADGADERAADAGTAVDGSPIAAKRSGELDEIKDRILSEISKFSAKREADAAGVGSGRAEQFESKIFTVVERVMDRAITEWDKMPDEKRADIINKIHVGIEKAPKKKESKKSSNPGGDIVWGLAATAGFAVWFSQTGAVWTIVVGVIVGVLPLISGIRKLISRSVRNRRKRRSEPAELEGALLKAAKELGGRVTVVQVAAHTGRSLDEVQRGLDQMTVRGYVSQEVLDSGVVRYDFPSLFRDDTAEPTI